MNNTKGKIDWNKLQKEHLASRDAIGGCIVRNLTCTPPNPNEAVKWMREYLYNHNQALACAISEFKQSTNNKSNES